MYPRRNKEYVSKSMQEVTGLTSKLNLKECNKDELRESKPIFWFSSLDEYFDHCDDSIYNVGEPFDKLHKLMFNMHENKIKKRIIQHGKGPRILCDSIVTIIYKVYTEYSVEPFDYTPRTGPQTIALFGDQLFPGLSIAIQTMFVGEISQFLLNAQFAYGDANCFNLSPDTSILFLIEIKRAVNLKKTFRDNFITAIAFGTKGNEMFSKGLFRQAIKKYREAIAQLKVSKIRSNIELEKQRKLSLLLYTNLVIASTKIQETRSACDYSKIVYDMCRETNLKVPVKVYVNHSRSLVLLSDFKEAEQLLCSAQRSDPANQEIAKEIFKLQQQIKEKGIRRVVPIKSIRLTTKPIEISEQFKETIVQYCCDLLNDKETTEYELPCKLTKAEQEFVLGEIQNHRLFFKEREVNGATTFFISKKRTFCIN